jgi:hypothetical protein
MPLPWKRLLLEVWWPDSRRQLRRTKPTRARLEARRVCAAESLEPRHLLTTVVSVQATNATAYEQTLSPGTVVFTQSGGNMMQQFTIQYLVSGTVSQGVNLQNLPGTITFQPGQQSVSLSLTPIDNHVPGPNLTCVISVGSGAGYGAGTPGSATVNIVPDSSGGATLQLSDGSTNLANNANESLGSTTVGSAVTKTLSIKDTGSTALNVSTLSASGGFNVSTPGPLMVSPGMTTTFTVTMPATASGSQSGQLTINSNDSASPLHINLSGTVSPAAAPAIGVADSTSSSTVANGGADPFGTTPLGTAVQRAYTVTNPGTANLTLGTVTVPSGFSLMTTPSGNVAAGGSTSFTVQMNGTASGSVSGAVSFSDNVAGANPFQFTISGQVTVPGLVVQDGSTTLTNGSTDAFPNTPLGTPIQKVINISNNGTGTLTLGNVAVPSGFSLIAAPAASVAPGATTSLTVQMNASVAGTATGLLSFSTNVPGTSTYQVSLSGLTTAPALAVLDGALPVANGSTDAFPSTLLGTPIQKVFTVSNAGTSLLTLGTVSVPSGFSLVTPPASSVAASGSTSFTVAMNASTSGTASGALSFSDNVPGAGQFQITISGVTTAPAISVLDGAQTLTSGSTDVFPSTPLGTSVQKVFTVTNPGTATLTLGSVTVPGGFSLVTPPSGNVAPGATTTFTVQANASAPGTVSGPLSFTTNVAGASPFFLTISDQVTVAAVSVSDGAVTIADGGSDNLGATFVGIPLTRSFSISNQGTGTLNLGTAQVPSGFTLAASPAASVAPGAATAFELQFPAVGASSASGTLQFTTNDPNNPVFGFTVAAQAVAAGAEVDGMALVDDTGLSNTDQITSDPRVTGVGNGNFSGGRLDVQFQESTDGGVTFTPDGLASIGTPGTAFTFDPRTAVGSLATYEGPLSLEYQPLEYDGQGNLAFVGAW